MSDRPYYADGYEGAILGLVFRAGEIPIVVYDRAKCIETLCARDGMNPYEAEEWLSFNAEGAWVGKGTPGYLHRMTLEEIDEYFAQDE